MKTSIIVSRHPAAVEFIRQEAGLGEAVPVVATATAELVKGMRVYGNLPLYLAAMAERVVAVEFAGQPPRGTEYTLEEMRAAGAYLAHYQVKRLGS